ncbi:MAG: zinc ABC transporter substrate-binding protein [Thiomargarita sp.]|nr:zinc ABC transporter substrate-binding protein [Thiomargarita sp.]
MLKKSITYVISLLWILTLTAQAEPQVVVTIKPIHALVSGVMEGVGTPYLLLQGGDSPHHYNLLPSQMRRLHNAQLVIWIGSTLEIFLEKILKTLDTERLRLSDTPGLTLLSARGETKHHHHHYIDPHIWLDPQNAKMMVQVIAQTLSKLDKDNTHNYSVNAKRLLVQLEQLDHTLKHQLVPIKNIPYLVFHEAYQYFEHRYELTAVSAITLSPDIRPSAKRLSQIRARIKKQKIRCVFTEPQFESSLVATLIEDTSVRRGILDPLGATLTAGKKAYFTLLHNLAQSLTQCLQDE